MTEPATKRAPRQPKPLDVEKIVDQADQLLAAEEDTPSPSVEQNTHPPAHEITGTTPEPEPVVTLADTEPTPVDQVRHVPCGTVFTPPPNIVAHIRTNTWRGGLDCPTCQLYRPLTDFTWV